MSVLALQKRDHIRLDKLLRRLTDLQPADQQPVLLRIYRLVFPHAFAEESILWPVIRRVLPEGRQLTLEVELEHQAINELVTRLESLEPGTNERRRVLDRVVDLLRQDVRDEEDELLPRLQAKLTTSQLRWLGVAWEVVRRVAPTRAHPIVARRPPGNVLAAAPLSVLDRCRDSVDGLLHRHFGPGAEMLRTFSSALTKASHLVEQLPGMRSGEHPATRVRSKRRVDWLAVGVATAASAAIVLAWRRR